MASTSSTSSTTSSATSLFGGTRMSGLMSGLDTESIVKQMASGTKGRINTQQKKLDLLTWKQSSYRSVISKMSTFKDTYLNSLKSDTYIKSNYLMAAYKATSSNSKVSATASSSANAQTYNITNIQQLAENAKIDSNYGAGGITNGIKLDFSSATAGNSYSVNVTLDGLSKDVTFTAGGTSADTLAAFNASLATAFSTSNLSADSNGNLKYAGDSISHNFSIQAAKTSFTGTSDEIIAKQQQSLSAIGLSEGASNKIKTSSKLKDINFSTPLNGGSFSFEINGKSFSFTEESTIKDVINTINGDTDANVTIAFDSLGQKFSLSSEQQGTASSITIKQTSGNFLNSILGDIGIKDGGIGSASFKATGVTGNVITDTNFNDVKNSQVNITLNGVTKPIGIWGYDANGSKNDFSNTEKGSTGAEKATSALNAELIKAFGNSAPQFKYADNKISLVSTNLSDTISISTIDGDSTSAALASKLGFGTTTTNEITDSSKISQLLGGKTGEFTVGGTTISITADTTVSELKTTLENAGVGTVDLKSGVISVKQAITASTDADKAFVSALFNEDYNTLNTYSEAAGSDSKTISGKNAILTINGTTITNASNNISIDGTTINIGNLGATDISKINAGEAVTIGTVRDTSKAFDAVVKFVNDYNTLISDLYTEINTNRPTSDGTVSGTKYDPLTEEQKAEMSEKQIEQWEEKAKTGLLYSDSTISNVLSKLRTAMNTRNSDNFSLSDMGITVSSSYKDNGKLIIDESKLRSAFEKNSDKIQQLFTDSEKGLATAVEKAVDSAISTKRDAYGSLTQLAGIANTATQADNQISKQIEQYNKTISSLKTSYQKELNRYWSQFTQLETMMSKYSQQASMFTQQSS